MVVSGIDISSFQAGITIIDSVGKKQNYLPTELNGFGIYDLTDTLHFLPVHVPVGVFISATKEKWFFMNIVDRRFIKVYFYLDVISEYGGGYSGKRRVPTYVVQKSGTEMAIWLYATKKQPYKGFFKSFIPEHFSFFESLSENAKRDEVLKIIDEFNSKMEKHN